MRSWKPNRVRSGAEKEVDRIYGKHKGMPPAPTDDLPTILKKRKKAFDDA